MERAEKIQKINVAGLEKHIQRIFKDLGWKQKAQEGSKHDNLMSLQVLALDSNVISSLTTPLKVDDDLKRESAL